MNEKIFLVKWEDSRQPRESWEWITDNLIPKCTSCMSVGVIVAESDNAILLSPTIGHEEDGDRQMIGAITIAKRQIVEITYLSSLTYQELESNRMQQLFSRFSAYLYFVKVWLPQKLHLCRFFHFLPWCKFPVVDDIEEPNAPFSGPRTENLKDETKR
ncbi:MAG: hypothetical protein WCI11_18950 [Candidatus Methylumidiphilus sp.]